MSGGSDHTLELLEDLASYACRPLAFVLWAFPWEEAGELERRTGPEKWQRELLGYLEAQLLAGLKNQGQVIAEAIQIATRSGHDIGKSALVCWLIIWAVSTREDTKGVVTANTEKQLRLKLWAELSKWHRLFIARQFFKVTATSIQAADPDREREWRIDAIPWSEDNPEAFAGLHNFGKRILVIFDEASGIVDKIWETVDGVMNEAETELIWVVTGNPTRNTGRFRECFDATGQGQFWHPFKVDSREVSFTNKERIERSIALWGEDSDYVKVRFLGEFPEQGGFQFFNSEDIREAMHRDCLTNLNEPLILGCDIARGGDDETVIVMRRGKDLKSNPPIRLRKADNYQVAEAISALMTKHTPDAVFIDEGGVGGGVLDILRRFGHSPIPVNFGGKPGMPTGYEKVANKRAEMYCNLRTWIKEGGVLPYSSELLSEMVGIEYGFRKEQGPNAGALQLAPKDDLTDSPDWTDAMVLTFAYPVSGKTWRGRSQMLMDYDPLGAGALAGSDTPSPMTFSEMVH